MTEKPKPISREERLAQALRENLRRRKRAPGETGEPANEAEPPQDKQLGAGEGS